MTFTKLFSSITESTVWCEDDQTRIVWITMLAMANKNGFVFASEPGLANRARVPLPSVLKALERFLAPDPYSRSKEHEGRRIEAVDGGWRLLNYQKHRDIRHEEDRRGYMREYMRKKRSLTPDVNNVSQCKPELAQAEAEAEAEADKIKVKSIVHFVHPTLEEVTAYCQQRGNIVDPRKWFDHYSANGWKVGRNSMKDWRAAVRNWERNQVGDKQHVNQTSKIAERTQRNREAILAGLGISADAGSVGTDHEAGSAARRGALLAGDVQD